MRISFHTKKHRFTLSTGEDDVELYDLQQYDESDVAGAMEFLQMIDGSFDLSPTKPGYEDAEYVDDDEGEEDPGYRTRRTPHSFGFAPRKNG